MIPKVIHYCWFGGNPLPDEYKKNIETWKKYMPDFKIIQWDESNFDVNKIQFTREAYAEKKYAFVSDYARLDIIYNYGGIYLDTDVEVIKSFDDLLKNKAFMGMEVDNFVATGLGFGAIKKHKGIKKNKEIYEHMSIYDDNGEINLTPCPIITNQLLKENGAKLDGHIEQVLDITIYPIDYFCPMDYYNGKVTITDNTHSIHKYKMSWGSPIAKRKMIIQRKMCKYFGNTNGKFITKIICFPMFLFDRIKNKGFIYTCKYYKNKIMKR